MRNGDPVPLEFWRPLILAATEAFCDFRFERFDRFRFLAEHDPENGDDDSGDDEENRLFAGVLVLHDVSPDGCGFLADGVRFRFFSVSRRGLEKAFNFPEATDDELENENRTDEESDEQSDGDEQGVRNHDFLLSRE